MSKNVELGGNTYNGVATVKIPLAESDGYAEFSEQNLQEKTVTENGEVTPDAGYTGLSKVTVNVSGGGGSTLKEASGTIDALAEDASELRITSLDFTPKAFRINPASGSAAMNASGGGMYCKGCSCVFRSGASSTTQGAMSLVVSDVDATVHADDYSPAAGQLAVLEHGFAVKNYSGSFPFRAGMAFTWYAVG